MVLEAGNFYCLNHTCKTVILIDIAIQIEDWVCLSGHFGPGMQNRNFRFAKQFKPTALLTLNCQAENLARDHDIFFVSIVFDW